MAIIPAGELAGLGLGLGGEDKKSKADAGLTSSQAAGGATCFWGSMAGGAGLSWTPRRRAQGRDLADPCHGVTQGLQRRGAPSRPQFIGQRRSVTPHLQRPGPTASTICYLHIGKRLLRIQGGVLRRFARILPSSHPSRLSHLAGPRASAVSSSSAYEFLGTGQMRDRCASECMNNYTYIHTYEQVHALRLCISG